MDSVNKKTPEKKRRPFRKAALIGWLAFTAITTSVVAEVSNSQTEAEESLEISSPDESSEPSIETDASQIVGRDEISSTTTVVEPQETTTTTVHALPDVPPATLESDVLSQQQAAASVEATAERAIQYEPVIMKDIAIFGDSIYANAGNPDGTSMFDVVEQELHALPTTIDTKLTNYAVPGQTLSSENPMIDGDRGELAKYMIDTLRALDYLPDTVIYTVSVNEFMVARKNHGMQWAQIVESSLRNVHDITGQLKDMGVQNVFVLPTMPVAGLAEFFSKEDGLNEAIADFNNQAIAAGLVEPMKSPLIAEDGNGDDRYFRDYVSKTFGGGWDGTHPGPSGQTVQGKAIAELLTTYAMYGPDYYQKVVLNTE